MQERRLHEFAFQSEVASQRVHLQPASLPGDCARVPSVSFLPLPPPDTAWDSSLAAFREGSTAPCLGPEAHREIWGRWRAGEAVPFLQGCLGEGLGGGEPNPGQMEVSEKH